MISVVLYGRNDSYGYNLHKRAALSLNCIAEVLDDPDDEILFVDYNTPDDFPTFPEAIQDTLTAKAKARLRILRARPSLHERFKGKTHLQALEPVARNIAIRRSNPANCWILSTNTDMIFVPRRGESLSAMVRDLPKGYYGIPRFELPESLWETLDRYDAAGTIEKVGAWGWQFHLNEIVYGAPTIKFDAPGDFQLMDRADLFKIHGFNEEMLLGWHVDSNICKRLFMLYGQVGELTDRLFGYHCDHTRQVTPMHRRTAVENSLSEFVDGVIEPGLSKQTDHWGCSDVEIEDTRLDGLSEHRYVESLTAAIRRPMTQASDVAYVRESYDKVGYDSAHVLPYLTDVLSSAPKHWNVAWFGIHKDMFRLFCAAWPAMGFTGSIFIPETEAKPLLDGNNEAIIAGKMHEILSEANVFVVDFGDVEGAPFGEKPDPESAKAIGGLVRNFHSIVRAEHDRAWQPAAPRRVIAINAIHNRFESLARGHIEFARSPFSGRLRHGYVLPPPKESTSWLELMVLKGAAKRVGSSVCAQQSLRGPVISGPNLSLVPGQYRVMLEVEPQLPGFPTGWVHLLLATVLGSRVSKRVPRAVPQQAPKAETAPLDGGKWKKSGAMAIEIRNGKRLISRRSFSMRELWQRRRYQIGINITEDDFDSPDLPAINMRIWSSGQLGFIVRTLNLVAGDDD